MFSTNDTEIYHSTNALTEIAALLTEKLLYVSQFLLEIFVVGTHWKHLNEKHLNEMLPMSSHNI